MPSRYIYYTQRTPLDNLSLVAKGPGVSELHRNEAIGKTVLRPPYHYHHQCIAQTAD